MVFRYGHASGEFVFEATRVYDLKWDLREEARMRASLPPNIFPVELVIVTEEDIPLASAGAGTLDQ
jgi:hypothetical protein